MTTYRVGQRVRIEWSNGDAIEGRIENCSGTLYLWYGYGVGSVGVRRMSMELIERDGRINVTILSEPRPDEPTGLGAVVECHTSARPGRRVCYRNHNSVWWDIDAGGMREWDDLIDPVVLSEGWAP